jgi:hypothetical protein
VCTRAHKIHARLCTHTHTHARTHARTHMDWRMGRVRRRWCGSWRCGTRRWRSCGGSCTTPRTPSPCSSTRRPPHTYTHKHSPTHCLMLPLARSHYLLCVLLHLPSLGPSLPLLFLLPCCFWCTFRSLSLPGLLCYSAPGRASAAVRTNPGAGRQQQPRAADSGPNHVHTGKIGPDSAPPRTR